MNEMLHAFGRLSPLLFLAALCAFAPGAASAQQRDNVYAVSGVHVDETAANAAAAQQAGFAAAQRARLSSAWCGASPCRPNWPRAACPLRTAPRWSGWCSSVDVEEERRSGTRYIGRLTVRFDPAGVRALLRGQQSDRRRYAHRADTGRADRVSRARRQRRAALWREVLGARRLRRRTRAARGRAGRACKARRPGIAAAPFAQAAAAASALYATLRVQGSTATATAGASECGNAARDRGEVTARIERRRRRGLARRTRLAWRASQHARAERLEKRRVATGAANARASRRRRSMATRRNGSRSSDALEGAAQTLISEIRIEAVGREGALVSFSFVGDRAQLGGRTAAARRAAGR